MASVRLNTLEPLRMKVYTVLNTLLRLCLAVEALSEPQLSPTVLYHPAGCRPILIFSSVFFFFFVNPIIHWDLLRHPVAMKEEEESSKPEEFTGKPLCGGKSCFIVLLSGQAMVKHSRSARKQRYIILSFDVIVLKYAVFSKNNSLFDWRAGFLMIFKRAFFFFILMKQITAVRAELNSFHKVAAKAGFPVRSRIKSAPL